MLRNAPRTVNNIPSRKQKQKEAGSDDQTIRIPRGNTAQQKVARSARQPREGSGMSCYGHAYDLKR
jgi:hypothetical protein